MALPLLLAPLLGLGTLAAGRSMAGSFNQADQERFQEQYRQLAASQQAGLDLSTPEGNLGLASRMMMDPRTSAGGQTMLQSAMQRRQQQGQFEQEFGNLSAYQQAQMQQRQMEMQQQAALEADKYRAQMEANQVMAQQAGVDQMIKRRDAWLDQYGKVADPWRQERGAMQSVMDILADPDASNADATAAIAKFQQALQGGRYLRPGDGSDPGLAAGIDQLGNFLDTLSTGKKLGQNEQRQLIGTILKLYGGASESFGNELANIRKRAAPDPYLMLPGFDPTPYEDPSLVAPLRIPTWYSAEPGKPGKRKPLTGTIDRSRLIKLGD